MVHVLRAFIVVLSFTVFFASCEGDVEAEIPAYVTIDSIAVTYDRPSTTGAGGTNVTEAWVFVNDRRHGVFSLPATFPIALSGQNKITVGPGIRNNGIAATRDQYALYERWETEVNLTLDSTVTLFPSVRYLETAVASWLEDFEDSGLSIDSSDLGDVDIQRERLDQINPTYGQFVGKVEISEDRPGMKLLTSDYYELPGSGTPVYLEMDYRCNQQFLVGVIVETSTQVYEEPYIWLNPTDQGGNQWNKIYINLTELVSFTPGALRFGLTFTANYSSANSSGLFYFDNLKIIHR